MDKIKIGLPRGLYYYYYKDIWKILFHKLDIEIVESDITNKQIIENGINYANDEMCLSLKIFLGHVHNLLGKCDYILIPRIDNYGVENQTCTNFLALYDIVKNIFEVDVLNYNIDIQNHKTERKGFLEIGKQLQIPKERMKKAYLETMKEYHKLQKKRIRSHYSKLKSNRLKVLIISHPYNLKDPYIGKPILDFLYKMNVEVIESDWFDVQKTNEKACELTSTLYWKYSKESIGAIPIASKYVDGIIFLSSFPCGPDSLVNELVMRRISKPYLSIVLDDIDGFAGIETRMESFIDILEQKVKM